MKVKIGDVVTLGKKDEQTWPAFIWAVDAAGIGGWVPERYFRRIGAADAAEVVRGYDTTELSADAGSVVKVLDVDVESGWLWCRADNGAAGWVPILALEDAEAP
ncbi:SH3 domain-containing protein [Micromonospora sp. WMMA1363]|nr:SH3 domain-containing protein [Micromonospora sp. WMMA1363]MDM4721876.1 SH3 domain-containing protein [Micromonospora sp. WMMA1363]